MAGSNFRLNFIQFAAVVSSRKKDFSFALWQDSLCHSLCHPPTHVPQISCAELPKIDKTKIKTNDSNLQLCILRRIPFEIGPEID